MKNRDQYDIIEKNAVDIGSTRRRIFAGETEHGDLVEGVHQKSVYLSFRLHRRKNETSHRKNGCYKKTPKFLIIKASFFIYFWVFYT